MPNPYEGLREEAFLVPSELCDGGGEGTAGAAAGGGREKAGAAAGGGEGNLEEGGTGGEEDLGPMGIW